jgi:peptidoglycan/xylan/chitin deacetylase (PgdA/CDA1 family)
MRSLVIKTICYFSYYTGIIRLFYLLNKKQRVITYHNIIPDSLFDHSLHLGFSHTESSFKKNLEIVNKRFKVTTQPGVRRTVMLTFDDGFSNNFSIAAKALDSYHYKAIFFVPVAVVDSADPLWIDEVMFWFSYVPQGRYRVFGLDLEIGDGASRLRGYEAVYLAMVQDYTLKDGILELLDGLYSFGKIDIDPELYRLRFTGITHEQIDLLKGAGHLIGSHSVGHDILSKLDGEALRRDLESSFRSPYYNNTFISYPFGGEEEISPSVVGMFREVGFTCAFTNIVTDDSDAFLLSRFCLPNTCDGILIEAELSGFLGWFRRDWR